MKCKGCEYLKIDKPDKWNEGYAYCTKYNLSTMLFFGSYKRKVAELECYEDELKEQKE